MTSSRNGRAGGELVGPGRVADGDVAGRQRGFPAVLQEDGAGLQRHGDQVALRVARRDDPRRPAEPLDVGGHLGQPQRAELGRLDPAAEQRAHVGGDLDGHERP